jgi:hypothetical protein
MHLQDNFFAYIVSVASGYLIFVQLGLEGPYRMKSLSPAEREDKQILAISHAIKDPSYDGV